MEIFKRRLPWLKTPRFRELRVSLATRLTLSFLAVIIISSLIFTIVGVQIISRLIISEAEDRVRNDLNAASYIYDNQIAFVQQAAEFTAARTFIEDILEGNVTAADEEELIWFKSNEGLDALTITDRNGVVVFRTSNPGAKGDSQRNQEIVGTVLRTRTPAAGTTIVPAEELAIESPFLAERAFFEFVHTPMARPRPETRQTAGMMQMAAVPILDNNGDLIGVVYAGKLLNRNYEIVDEVKRTVFQGVVYEGKDIGTATIFQDDVRISTNVLNGDGSRAIGTRIAQNVYDQVVVQGKQYIGRAYVVNDWYIAAYEPIKNIDGSTIGILYVGILEQKYTDINNRASFIFLGITLAGVILSILITLFISRNISTSIGNLAAAAKQLANGNLEAKAKKTSNDEIGELADTFNLMATALKDRDDKIKEFTKKKIMESERLALIGQLSANVAHDLNNPLQGIVTYSYLLLEDESSKPEAKDNLQKIVVQANRCRDIIRGLLDFSRQKKPDKTLCNINNLLQGCISLVEKQAQFQNIKVIINLDENLPMVVLDPSQVERVFLNLIINAAEAMDGNGQLTLSTQLNRENNSVEIKVQDTGHGISDENMEKIFDPFFTTKETGHGVGLGLAISFGIVKEHNGNISVESILGEGTTFTVSFPLTKMTAGIENGSEVKNPDYR
jgi:two-component system NtrC family sensor kinase